MSEQASPKPLFWVGSSRRDLRRFALDVRKTIGFAMWQAQNGGMHPAVKPLKGFGGAGVLEVMEDEGNNTYRAVYTVKFSGAVYVLHAFQKKSKKGIKTPQADLDLIRKRLKTAKEHYEDWRASHDEGKGA